MKFRIFVSLGGFFTLVMVLSLALLRPDQADMASKQYLKAISTTGVTSKSIDLPIYPGAHYVQEYPSSSGSYNQFTDFRSADDIQTIARYYDTLLRNQGCELFFDDSAKSDSKSFAYSWSDTQGLVPYRFFVYIDLLDAKANSEWISSSNQLPAHDAATLVRTSISRFPDPANLPLYGAPTLTNTEYITGSNGDVVKIISYLTDVALSEVETYYSEHMPDWGWRVQDGANYLDTVTFGFFDHGPIEIILYGNASITVKPDASGHTNVELRVSGYNIKGPPEESHK